MSNRLSISTRRPRRVAFAVAAASLAFGAAACSGSSQASSPTPAPTNDNSAGHGMNMPAAVAPLTGAALDKAWLSGMVPHHKAALDMAKVEVARGKNPKVKALAASIIADQQKEIGEMTGIATATYSFTPATSHSGGMGELMGVPLSMDMSTMGQELSGQSNTDHAFLMMMIPHHASAIVMSDEEAKKGAAPKAKTLAMTIVRAQAREVGQMQGLLTSGV